MKCQENFRMSSDIILLSSAPPRLGSDSERSPNYGIIYSIPKTSTITMVYL